MLGFGGYAIFVNQKILDLVFLDELQTAELGLGRGTAQLEGLLGG